MFHVGVCLTGTDSETQGELTDESHRISYYISFFTSHTFFINKLNAAKLQTFLEFPYVRSEKMHELKQWAT